MDSLESGAQYPLVDHKDVNWERRHKAPVCQWKSIRTGRPLSTIPQEIYRYRRCFWSADAYGPRLALLKTADVAGSLKRSSTAVSPCNLPPGENDAAEDTLQLSDENAGQTLAYIVFN
jgi:hypothetical protein